MGGFGIQTCAGLLSGALVSSVQLAISMSNTGGAWDNSKKYISAGGLGKEYVKGSEAHKNSVTGDTVGDPLKDTSGPALNIVMKLTAIICLVFGTVIHKWSNKDGGPFWLSVGNTPIKRRRILFGSTIMSCRDSRFSMCHSLCFHLGHCVSMCPSLQLHAYKLPSHRGFRHQRSFVYEDQFFYTFEVVRI